MAERDFQGENPRTSLFWGVGWGRKAVRVLGRVNWNRYFWNCQKRKAINKTKLDTLSRGWPTNPSDDSGVPSLFNENSGTDGTSKSVWSSRVVVCIGYIATDSPVFWEESGIVFVFWFSGLEHGICPGLQNAGGELLLHPLPCHSNAREPGDYPQPFKAIIKSGGCR